ncbi:dephospho-CoA kinase [Dethiosulfatibacter aminovorans DSM 17477]|uniref:Dephospho-CoA kinase n=1 Tax=Dethiosulfatibacter aminovorans DSM 17477 TaxID=1121476 RepID=A0A1M6FV15_9FIRM|nr:dephospho-CoA kinase [Dethiosulfatibacter aminovorans]SHJ01536.1 dephospho-CoA kinase [Dethiosulfatibacter aminovorans DSM 17477]
MIQNKRLIIITGGIATGKSTVSKTLMERGYKVLDSDRIVHELYNKGSVIHGELVEAFGSGILDDKDEIDRKKLAKIVFSSDDNRNRINGIVHKAVIEELERQINKSGDNLIFLDIPLAIEELDHLKEYGLSYDEIWLVYSDRDTQLERLLKRDNRGMEESVKIIDSQMDIEEKKKHADRIIDNSTTLANLMKNLDSVLEKQGVKN